MKVLIILAALLACALAQFHWAPHHPHPPMGQRPTGGPMEGFGPHGHQHPTGRPGGARDFWKDWRDRMDAWRKSAMKQDEDETQFHWAPHHPHPPMGQRPTGGPMEGFGPHGHQHPTGRPGGARDFWKDWRERMDAWRKSAMGNEEDETEVLGESYADHIADFKMHFQNLMEGRPTGRPGRKQVLLKSVQQKFRELMSKLNKMRPTGRPTEAHIQAVKNLKKLFKKARNQVKKSKRVDSDETEILFADQAAAHFQKVKSIFNDLYRNRPTGEPKEFVKLLGKKFVEVKKLLHGMRPTGGPPAKEDKMYQKYLNKIKALKHQLQQKAKKNRS